MKKITLTGTGAITPLCRYGETRYSIVALFCGKPRRRSHLAADFCRRLDCVP